jgi:hypothetical protein
MTRILMCLQKMPPPDKSAVTKHGFHSPPRLRFTPPSEGYRAPLWAITMGFRASHAQSAIHLSRNFHKTAEYAGISRSSMLPVRICTQSFASSDGAVSVQRTPSLWPLPPRNLTALDWRTCSPLPPPAHPPHAPHSHSHRAHRHRTMRQRRSFRQTVAPAASRDTAAPIL